MAFAVGGAGVSFLASTLSIQDTVYDPVYDQAFDGNLIFGLLPSYYRDLMGDNEIFASYWAGMMQASSNLLLDAWQADAGKSLSTVPIWSQHKWIKYDFLYDLIDGEDPDLSILGRSALFVYDGPSRRLGVTWSNRAGVDRAYVALNDTATQDTSLSWSFTFTLSAKQAGGVMLVGYYNSASRSQLVNSLVAGVQSRLLTGGPLRPILVHFAADGTPTDAAIATTLSLDTEYTFEARYAAGTTEAVLDAYETKGTKLSGVTGDTAEGDGVYTNQITDTLSDFDALGIVAGDYLVISGVEYEISGVDGNTLTTRIANVPAGAVAVSYSVVGKLALGSCSINLAATASDPDFSVNQFGTSNLDLIKGKDLFSIPTSLGRRKLVGETWDWQYLDPTTEYRMISVPRLQDRVTDATEYLYEGVDYSVEDKMFIFESPPTRAWWAEFSAYDLFTIETNFGNAVDLQGDTDAQYRAKVRGLYYSYYQGPTLSAIQRGVHILVGLPVAEKAGRVDSINPAYSGDLGEIVVEGRSYTYPLDVGTSLTVGDVVELYEPLSDGVEVRDYIVDPDWFLSAGLIREVQKYHTFLVRLALDVFDAETLSDAAEFTQAIKPTWKGVFFQVYKDIEDSVDIDDDLTFKVTVGLRDSITDYVDPSYDDAEWEGDDDDWRYDQGVTDWDETSAAMRGSGKVYTNSITGSNYLTGTLTMTASTAVTGTGTDFVAEIDTVGPPAPDAFLMVAKRSTGTAGQTSSGSNTFTDLTASAFADVEVGDIMNVDGTDYEVQSVTDDNNVVLSFTFPSTDSSLPWTHTGKLLLWGQIANINSTTSLTLSNSFTGDPGTYVGALVDTDMGFLGTDYKDIFFDQFLEYGILNPVEIDLDISVGYNETLLTGTVTFDDGTATVEGTGTSFVGEIGGPGVVTDKFIVDRNGEWYQVASVTDADTLVLSGAPSADFTDVPTYLASTVLTGTLNFTNGLAAVTGAGTSFTTELAAGDWIQVVPGADGPVKVLSITDNTNLTLSANYAGATATGTKAIDRGADATIFPLAVAGTPSPGSFTDFYGTSGGLVERDVD